MCMTFHFFCSHEIEIMSTSGTERVPFLDIPTSESLAEIRSIESPAPSVIKTLQALQVALNREATWDAAQRTLSDPALPEMLMRFPIDAKSLERYGEVVEILGETTTADVSSQSKAAGALFLWLSSTCSPAMHQIRVGEPLDDGGATVSAKSHAVA